MSKKYDFYSSDKIDKTEATYRIIIGERSNGKTYYILKKILKEYLETGTQGAYVRKYDIDIKSSGKTLFEGLIANGVLKDTKWDGIEYKSYAWYLYLIDESGKKIYDDKPLCYAFALNMMEHFKSSSYPNIRLIAYDEFISRRPPFSDEFALWCNTISTIVRHRKDVIIYMMANTVNKDCIYFKEMGLKNIGKMKPGDIDIYKYGETGLTVAVEYTNGISKDGKESDVYFAFDNPKLRMITNGAWEIAVYNRLSDDMKFTKEDIQKIFFVIWEDTILQCEIVHTIGIHGAKYDFLYVHEKTTELQDVNNDLIYCPEAMPRRNWKRRISDSTDRISCKLFEYFRKDKVYYQSNEIGEVMRNYLQYCQTFSIIKA